MIFCRLVKAVGIRKITFRHTWHSVLSYLLNSEQVPFAIVAACAGHANGGRIVLKHYIHLSRGPESGPTTPSPNCSARNPIYEIPAANGKP